MERTLDFVKNQIEVLSLDELKRTYREYDTAGNPVINGIVHYDLIDKVINILDRHKIDFTVQEIFAAQNKRAKDSVIIAKPIEEQYGKGSIESHALRRVFTTLQINTGEDDETNTGLVISYHNDGIQLAIGPNVKMCHNQCILGAQRVLQSYGGDNKVKDINKMMDIVDDWIHNFGQQREYDRNIIDKMKTISVNYNDVINLIGHMTSVRVAKDSRIKELRDKVKDIPLNQGQISEFTEKWMDYCVKKQTSDMMLWDLYNISTELYKPGQTEFPNIITQNVAWAELLTERYINV